MSSVTVISSELYKGDIIGKSFLKDSSDGTSFISTVKSAHESWDSIEQLRASLDKVGDLCDKWII
jgi:hypothetical protein